MSAAVLAAGTSGDVLAEVGGVLLVLAIAGRVAARFSIPSIPLYLAAGLLLGEGGLVGLDAGTDFIRTGADMGVVLLLLLLGLEYTPEELQRGMRSGWRDGLLDAALSFPPGLVAGLLLGWDLAAAALLGGITYVSSSGIIAKLLSDLDRVANRETPAILTILVFEDLAMAVYLPVMGVVIAGGDPLEGAASVVFALAVVAIGLAVSMRLGQPISRFLDTGSSELLLLTLLGLTLLIAGLLERVQVSAAIGAFLVGVTLSGQIAERGRELLVPIRDVFGGLFFVFFGIQVDPGALPPVLVPALLLAAVGTASKAVTGWWAARRAGIARRGRVRAGVSLVARGEFSIVIAGLGITAGLESELGPLAACYVLLLAVTGSLLMRFADALTGRTAAPAR